jgi:hypothetical protein
MEPKEGPNRGNAGQGRPKGSENKTTKRTREAIALIAEGMADEFRSWLVQTADGDPERGLKPDPKGAADIYLKAIEYHIPKLSRVEATVDGHMTLTHEQWLDQLK